MNNDFNFRPKNTQGDSSADETSESATPEQTENTTENTTTDNTPVESPAPQPGPAVVSKPTPGRARRFFGFLLLILLLAAVAGGVYYWQQSQVKNLTASEKALTSQVTALQASLAKEKASAGSDKEDKAPAEPATTYNIITGSVTSNTGSAADVTVQYLPGTVKEVWVEYGTKPDDLKTATKHMTATSAGTAGSYVEQAFALTSLQTGTQYFYRAAATVDGKTVYGGVVAFKATK